MPRLRPALAFAAMTLLAGCGSSEDDAAAPGEVVEGTISDEMLPLDRVTSQPPLADPVAAGREAGGAGSPPAQAPGEDAADPAPGDGEPGVEETPEPAGPAGEEAGE